MSYVTMAERNPTGVPRRDAGICTTQALETLGLPATHLDRRALNRAWRCFARAHHPDMCPGDPGAAARFARGREAFEVLRARTARGAVAPLSRRHGVVPASVARERVLAYAPPALHPREWVA